MSNNTLATWRDLENPLFTYICKALYNEADHGVSWVKQVFSLAGFRETCFHKAIETIDLPLSRHLSPTDRETVIRIATFEAKRAICSKIGYMYKHPVLGTFAIKRKEEVGAMFVIQHRTNGVFFFHTVNGVKPTITKSPSNPREFIVVDTHGKSSHVLASSVVGFWSNFLSDPREENTRL